MKTMKEKEVDAKKVIKDLAKSYGDSNEDQGKMVNLMKGLAFSDDAEANKFMKALDKWTTEYAEKNIKENVEESIIEIKEEIQIGDFVLEKGDKIRVLREGVETETIDYYRYAASALINGDYSGLDDEEERQVDALIDWVQKQFGREAHFIDVSEESYFGKPSSYLPPSTGTLAGDISEYTILYRE